MAGNAALAASDRRVKSRLDIYPGAILVLGILVVPTLLVVLSNSYAAPDDEAYIRMAFAAVAAHVVAICTALSVLIISIVRRAGVGSIVTFAIILAVVTSLGLNGIASQSEQLVRVLA
ncbi:hypothetical protein [Microbacterium sp.]|uniref:hypothetical protein n=1 Tax=Microbacterium sp. TaxID=51671 RepID=UPI002733F97F|nr:hypothetical protein [Microbacterium sp.]MDP3949585.1 hypothetical protein [Microbacterium sp.]